MRESKPTPFANMERRELAAKETFVPEVFINVVDYASGAHHYLVEWPRQKHMAIATYGFTLHYV